MPGRVTEVWIGIGAQGRAIKDRRAISSSPISVSPRISTVDSVGATVSTSFSTCLSADASPMISSKLCSVRISSLSSAAILSLSSVISWCARVDVRRDDGLLGLPRYCAPQRPVTAFVMSHPTA
jgi:hypothetical protein